MTVYGFLSTYPPTRCGLATFTAALASAIPTRHDADSRVVRVDDLVPTTAAVAGPRTELVGELRPGSTRSRAQAARLLNACDVVIVQHEYGIYGGRDGDEVLDVLDRVTAPCIVVLHTVRESPTAHQRWLLERVTGLASAVIVMTWAGEELLARRYTVPMAKVHVVPHGVAVWPPSRVPGTRTRSRVLTWGLLGPGKGLEWGIRALAEADAPRPRAQYVIAGQTHPKVLAESGETYRDSLVALVHELHLEDDVVFDGRYHDAAGLAELVAGADVVLLPYDSREQTTSGVLVEALAAGKPVVATRFPHAVELLSSGTGMLVDQRNPAQIARALRAVLARPAGGNRALTSVPDAALGNSWPDVAAAYRRIGGELMRASVA